MLTEIAILHNNEIIVTHYKPNSKQKGDIFMKIRFVPLALVIVLMATCVSAACAESASFDISSSSSSSWESASKAVQSIGNTWSVTFTSISEHGVGRGWISGTVNYATNKYTYNSSYEGVTTNEKGYLKTGSVIWKMRRDSDYSATFTAKGSFNP